jgi:hypothetical protein
MAKKNNEASNKTNNEINNKTNNKMNNKMNNKKLQTKPLSKILITFVLRDQIKPVKQKQPRMLTFIVINT